MSNLLTIDTGAIDWARAQFALTAIYHWLFVPLTLGLALIMGIIETIYYRKRDEFWLEATKFWQRLFGVNFAMGVATGIILEFEFGTNWSNYSWFVGDILRMEEGVGRLSPRIDRAHGPRRYHFGMVDSGGQRMDAEPCWLRV